MSKWFEQKKFAYTLQGYVADWVDSWHMRTNDTPRVARYILRLGVWTENSENGVSYHYFHETAQVHFIQWGQSKYDAWKSAFGLHPIVLPSPYISGMNEQDQEIIFTQANLDKVEISGAYHFDGMATSNLIAKAWSYVEKSDVHSPKHKNLLGGADAWKVDDLTRWLYSLHSLGARAVGELSGGRWSELITTYQWSQANILTWINSTDLLRLDQARKHLQALSTQDA